VRGVEAVSPESLKQRPSEIFSSARHLPRSGGVQRLGQRDREALLEADWAFQCSWFVHKTLHVRLRAALGEAPPHQIVGQFVG
jgi:hypothetical protein